jgi:hypothetical protein
VVLFAGRIELLVLDHSITEGGEEFTRLSWLRLPAGATVWVKFGHLARQPQLRCAA